MSQLNPRQKQAHDYIDGPMLVLAGAGSGKTSVITQKIAYLIEECGYSAQHIAALTFTNKAAREMKERVSKLLSGKAGRGLTVSTFHNLGLNIIRKECDACGYRPGFSIFDDVDCKSMLRDLMMREGDLDTDLIDTVQRAISSLKNDMIEPEQAVHEAENPQELLVANLYASYNRHLLAYNAVDFDDLILIPTLLFKQNPDVLKRWQRKIRYLLVDEYQDTNTSQYELVKMIVKESAKFTVVGDDDQSIYSWRGARPENLMLLQQDFPALKVVKLEQNYRSTGLILNAANTVISNNPHEFTKELWCDKGYGDPIRVLQCKNEDDEADRIVTQIIERRLQNHGTYKDFAILYRGNHQSRLLEIKLQAYQVPYKITGGSSFFGKAEIKDIMSYLRLIINPADDAAFLRVINVPRREIGPSTLEKLSNYAHERGVGLMQACEEFGLEQKLKAQPLERIKRFSKWLQGISRQCIEGDAIQGIKEMVHDIDYESWLAQTSNSPAQTEKRMANVWYLVDSIKFLLDRAEESGEELGIEDAIAKMVLRDMLERQKEEEELDQVQLLTLHASKGLEYPHVYIMGMEEEVMPHRNSIEGGTVEEERRLMYVGITRAKVTLRLTMAKKRKQYGEVFETTPSRFLDELPPDDVEWEGRTEISKEVKQERGNAALAGLKNLLGG